MSDDDNSQRSPEEQLQNLKQQQQEFAEDKKCRICGFADTKNVNIFSPGNCKQLVTKILTVYPIILYKNDPLPKNICRKCIGNVGIMYNDIVRVMKMQIKWVNNVRTVQPHNNYIRVLDLIQNTNAVTRESIKNTLAEDVKELNVSRLLFANKLESSSSTTSKRDKFKNTFSETQSSSKHTSTSFSIDFEDEASSKSNHHSKTESRPLSTGSTEIKDIKSLLEQNGCSLLHVNSQKSLSKKASKSNVKSKSLHSPAAGVKIKEEKIGSEARNDNILLSILSKEPTLPSATAALPGPPPPLTVKCRLCPLQFNSLASLATHQIIHMRLCVPKMFQKKYLHKRLRRGRLITVQDRKCIRCLNCWRIFVDNKSILEHWSMGECDFYCHICGKEFAQAPKMLREHVPAAHGINYRSSKFNRMHLSSKLMTSLSQTSVEENSDYKLYQSVSEQEPLPFEELGGRSQQSKPKAGHKKQLSSATTTASSISLSQVARPTSNLNTTHSKSEVIQNEDGTVSCHLCMKVFQNIKARNSHMRKHKPVYAYGDMVLPPVIPPNLYVREETEEDIAYAEELLTYNGLRKKMKSTLQNQEHSTSQMKRADQAASSTTPSTNSSSSQLRGVRTKFVKPRNALYNSKTVSGDSSGVGSSALKVKSLNELRKPLATECVVNTWVPLTTTTEHQQTEVSITAAREIKREPMDVEQPKEQRTFTCIPCSGKFSSKLELFRHKRKCRTNYLFSCEYCSESFRCSADYQQHIGQYHRNSNRSANKN